MGASVLIGPAGPEDWPALADLWVASWQANWQENWPRDAAPIDFAARRPWLLDLFGRMGAAEALFLAARDEDGALLGFALFDRAMRVLEQIAVVPSAQGRGVGQALLTALKAQAPGAIALSVNRANLRAMAFYERAGFVTAGEGVNPLSGLPIVTMHFVP